MLVKDAQRGDIIELVYPGASGMIASGQFYKIGRKTIIANFVSIKGRKQYLPEWITLFPYNQCRKIDPATIEGF